MKPETYVAVGSALVAFLAVFVQWRVHVSKKPSMLLDEVGRSVDTFKDELEELRKQRDELRDEVNNLRADCGELKKEAVRVHESYRQEVVVLQSEHEATVTRMRADHETEAQHLLSRLAHAYERLGELEYLERRQIPRRQEDRRVGPDPEPPAETPTAE